MNYIFNQYCASIRISSQNDEICDAVISIIKLYVLFRAIRKWLILNNLSDNKNCINDETFQTWKDRNLAHQEKNKENIA